MGSMLKEKDGGLGVTLVFFFPTYLVFPLVVVDSPIILLFEI